MRGLRRSLGPSGWFAALLATLGLGALLLFVPPANQHVFGGFPQAQNWLNRLTVHVLDNPGFAVGYSEWHAGPAWVGYRLRRVEEHGGVGRLEHFGVDERTLRRISSADYRNSGFDRGHLAPNYAIAKLYGPAAQRASFELSNISPQAPRLNQLLWQRLEEAELDLFTPVQGELWVLTGPIYGDRPPRFGPAISIPEAYFRIWVREQGTAISVLAVRVPQSVCGQENPGDFLVSIDALEQETGWDFMPELADALEAELESTIQADAWPLQALAQRPARYADRFRGQRCD